MKVGFVIEGISNLKIFGPLIRESGKFSLEPVLILSKTGGGKEYDIITLETITRYFSEISKDAVYYYGNDTISEIVRKIDIKAALFINIYSKFTKDILELEKIGVSTYGLDYFANSIYTAARKGYEENMELSLKNLTKRFVISDYFKQIEFKIRPENKKFSQKFIVIGTPVTDNFKYIDPIKARKILQLPQGKKIVTLFTPNIRRRDLWSMYGLFAKSKIKRIIKIFKKFCEDNGYILVIKSREKQWDSELYRKYSDFFVYDPCPFPHASALLLSVSSLMVHFGSMGVFEAAAAFIPSLGIEVNAIDALHHYMMSEPRQIIKNEMFSDKSGSPFNFGKVSQGISINESFENVSKVCGDLIGLKDEEEYREYNKKFINTYNYDASEKILSRISKNI